MSGPSNGHHTRVLTPLEFVRNSPLPPFFALGRQIEGFPPNCRHCMWDQVDRDVMMASGGKELHTYVHSHTTIRGSMVGFSAASDQASCPIE